MVLFLATQVKLFINKVDEFLGARSLNLCFFTMLTYPAKSVGQLEIPTIVMSLLLL